MNTHTPNNNRNAVSDVAFVIAFLKRFRLLLLLCTLSGALAGMAYQHHKTVLLTSVLPAYADFTGIPLSNQTNLTINFRALDEHYRLVDKLFEHLSQDLPQKPRHRSSADQRISLQCVNVLNCHINLVLDFPLAAQDIPRTFAFLNQVIWEKNKTSVLQLVQSSPMPAHRMPNIHSIGQSFNYNSLLLAIADDNHLKSLSATEKHISLMQQYHLDADPFYQKYIEIFHTPDDVQNCVRTISYLLKSNRITKATYDKAMDEALRDDNALRAQNEALTQLTSFIQNDLFPYLKYNTSKDFPSLINSGQEPPSKRYTVVLQFAIIGFLVGVFALACFELGRVIYKDL